MIVKGDTIGITKVSLAVVDPVLLAVVRIVLGRVLPVRRVDRVMVAPTLVSLVLAPSTM